MGFIVLIILMLFLFFAWLVYAAFTLEDPALKNDISNDYYRDENGELEIEPEPDCESNNGMYSSIASSVSRQPIIVRVIFCIVTFTISMIGFGYFSIWLS